jgi:hypothetical protein
MSDLLLAQKNPDIPGGDPPPPPRLSQKRIIGLHRGQSSLFPAGGR